MKVIPILEPTMVRVQAYHKSIIYSYCFIRDGVRDIVNWTAIHQFWSADSHVGFVTTRINEVQNAVKVLPLTSVSIEGMLKAL